MPRQCAYLEEGPPAAPGSWFLPGGLPSHWARPYFSGPDPRPQGGPAGKERAGEGRGLLGRKGLDSQPPAVLQGRHGAPLRGKCTPPGTLQGPLSVPQLPAGLASWRPSPAGPPPRGPLPGPAVHDLGVLGAPLRHTVLGEAHLLGRRRLASGGGSATIKHEPVALWIWGPWGPILAPEVFIGWLSQGDQAGREVEKGWSRQAVGSRGIGQGQGAAGLSRPSQSWSPSQGPSAVVSSHRHPSPGGSPLAALPVFAQSLWWCRAALGSSGRF